MVLATVLVAVLVMAVPAAAHPFFRGGEAPVDSLATLTLDLAHGCASETAGEGDPTDEVALEVPGWMRVVAVDEPEGWTVDVEVDDEGFAAVVVWEDAGGAEPAPAFDLDVVVDGEPGEERFVSVFQACDDVQYRWIGTPDAPADDPAVRLRLIDADPDAPAPDPAPIVEPEEPEDTTGTDDADETGPEEPEDAADATIAEGSEDDTLDDELASTETDEEIAEPLAADSEDTSGGLAWWLIVLVVLAVAGVAAAVVRSRGSSGASADVA